MTENFTLSINDYLNKEPNHSLQITKLLTTFKSNVKNIELLNYLTENNVFDALRKGRDEMTHSRMLADIFCGSFFYVSKEFAIHRFLDLLIEKALEQGVVIDKEITSSTLTSSLQITECIDVKTEYVISDYLKEYANKKHSTSRKRIDLYMRFDAQGLDKYGKHSIEFFIENKVNSCEHDNQTQTYVDFCSDKRRAAQFFVFLTVEDKMECSVKTKNASPAYIHITYQDIMDMVLMPLLQSELLKQRERYLLKEYINCLELPALDQQETSSYTIMATSAYEKQLIDAFTDDSCNRQLLALVIHSVLNTKLYSYFDNFFLTFDEALEKLIHRNYRNEGLYKTLKMLCSISGAQNGGSPFIINGVKQIDDSLYYVPTRLYEFRGMVFSSISAALNMALCEYSAYAGINDISELAKLFFPLYGRQKGGNAALVVSTSEDYKIHPELYIPTDFTDLFIRKKINHDRLFSINQILGSGHSIKVISEECYNNLNCSHDATFLEVAKSSQYQSVKGTTLYFRKNQVDKIDMINEAVDTSIKEITLSQEDEALLQRFYKSNYKLFLSVYRILIANESDKDVQKKMIHELHQLQKK